MHGHGNLLIFFLNQVKDLLSTSSGVYAGFLWFDHQVKHKNIQLNSFTYFY